MLNHWQNRFYNALQDRNWDSFVTELAIFSALVGGYAVLAVYQLYFQQWLQIRCRVWMTRRYVEHWLAGAKSLPHATSRRRRRQPGPPHRRRPAAVRGTGPSHRPAHLWRFHFAFLVRPLPLG